MGPLAADFRSWIGFGRRKRIAARFRRLCRPAMTRWSCDPRFEPHVDAVVMAARPGRGPFDGELWLIGDRIWSGWPDPPEFAFWALGRDGAVRCAWDYDGWPAAWRRPEQDDAARCADEME